MQKTSPNTPTTSKTPSCRRSIGTRGVIHSWANPDGTQKIESTGPLTKKRMETVDEEFTREALVHERRRRRPTSRSSSGGTLPACTSGRGLKQRVEGKTGLGVYPDGMVEHDGHVGQLLDKLKELGLERIPSSCIPRTMARRSSLGRTAARHRSATRRQATGKALTASRVQSAGRASSNPARCSTTSSRMRTCCRP